VKTIAHVVDLANILRLPEESIMPKSGGAVIPMQQENSAIKYIFLKTNSIEKMAKLPSLCPFDFDVCEFLNSLSEEIRKDRMCKQYPDIVTFGFFIRKARLLQMKLRYQCDERLGRGLTFHIAPSNVPINFAYSMVAGLLAGNACVIRVSEKEFVQTDILARLMEAVCKKNESCAKIGQYISLITYEKNKEINDALSALCDMRIIWGGDATIETLRKSPLPPRSGEITFADRYSLCVIDAKVMKTAKNMEQIATDFYNDTYLLDQNACSSPRLIYWIGEACDVKAAKEIFWDAIHQKLDGKYYVEPKIAVDKLVAGYKAAAEYCTSSGEKLDEVSIVRLDNLIQRIEVYNLSLDIREYVAPGGSFFEYQSEKLDDLFCIIDEKVQTISYFGMKKEDITDAIKKAGCRGIDRVVPMGKTAEFSLIWDGYDLIKTLSRVVYQN